MASSSNKLDSNTTTPDIPRKARDSLLPAKSSRKYLNTYENFLQWKQNKKISSFSENVFLSYFNELAKRYKPSTLWARYSMLKSTVKTKHNLDMADYSELIALLKRKSSGFKSTKSKVLSARDVARFLNEAPDNIYLATKVALIFGITGACRRDELVNLTVNDIKQQGDVFVVKIPDTDVHRSRTFIIEGDFFTIVKKYEALRLEKCSSNRYFQNYQNGKCVNQCIGVNKFGSMPKQIATFLKLPEPELYTGNSFRRTSATLLAHSGARVTTLDCLGTENEAGREKHTTNSDASKEKDPLSSVIEQCRFCGEFSKECSAVPENSVYLDNNKTTLAINNTSLQIDFNSQSLPKTVCRDCDAKLQEFVDFLSVVKAAQRTLIDVAEERDPGEFEDTEFDESRTEYETETVIVKTEYDSQQEDDDDDKEGIVDSLTVGETEFVKKPVARKRKGDAGTAKAKKLKAKEAEKSEDRDELVVEIKEEVIEEEKDHGENTEASDTETDVKPSELDLATSALVFEMAGDGTNYPGHRSDR